MYGQELTIKAGESAVIDCFNPHIYYTNDSFEAYWLHISDSNTQEIFEELTSRFGNIINANKYVEKQITDKRNLQHSQNKREYQ